MSLEFADSDTPNDCPDCDGTGILDGEDCPKCEGEGKYAEPKQEKRSVHYFKKLYGLIKDKAGAFMTEDDFIDMTRKARAHAGGKGKAKKRMEAKEEGLRVYTEQTFAQFSEWVQLLPKPGKYVHPVYGELNLDKDTISRIIHNFKELNYQGQLPIDTEHDEQKLKAKGAFGWIDDLRQATDGSVEARIDWTDQGREVITNKRFRYMSADILPKFVDPEGNEYKDVLRGAALCTRPFFKDKYMRPILATEDAVFAISDTMPEHYNRVMNDSSSKLYFTALEPVTKEVTTMGDNKPNDAPAKTGMNDEEAKQFTELTGTVKTLSEANESLKTANEQLSTKLTEAQEDNKKLSERVTAMEKDARRVRFTEQAKDFAGKTEDHVKFMEFIADNDEKGEQSEQLKAYVERERATAEQIKTAGLFSEFGHDAPATSLTALDKMKAEAKKFMEADPKLTEPQAMSMVMDKQPALYNEYLAEREGRAS